MRLSSSPTGPNTADGSGYETLKQESEAEMDRASPHFSFRPGFTVNLHFLANFWATMAERENLPRGIKERLLFWRGSRKQEDVKYGEKRLNERSLTGKNDGHRSTC